VLPGQSTVSCSNGIFETKEMPTALIDLYRILLRRGGRVAHPNGIEPAPEKRRGMTLIGYDGISGVREFERLNAAVQGAKLKVPIAECYPLAQARKSHERLAEGHVIGKIVLAVHDHI
jgi:NADPH2:quinone reductase